MDICFAALWYYTDSIDIDVKYICLRMLDWLVSTHPMISIVLLSLKRYSNNIIYNSNNNNNNNSII